MYANHGRLDKYDHELEGVNSRLDGLQAAILDVKLCRLEEWTELRRQNASLYNSFLQDSGLLLPKEAGDVKAVYHLYVVRVPHGRRQQLQAHLQAKGIATGIHYPTALPNLKAYKRLNHSQGDFPEATKASREILSLPMFPRAGRSPDPIHCRKHKGVYNGRLRAPRPHALSLTPKAERPKPNS
jgi:dTDP-4-amino-4,6-dideoxygalactose transaminase